MSLILLNEEQVQNLLNQTLFAPDSPHIFIGQSEELGRVKYVYKIDNEAVSFEKLYPEDESFYRDTIKPLEEFKKRINRLYKLPPDIKKFLLLPTHLGEGVPKPKPLKMSFFEEQLKKAVSKVSKRWNKPLPIIKERRYRVCKMPLCNQRDAAFFLDEDNETANFMSELKENKKQIFDDLSGLLTVVKKLHKENISCLNINKWNIYIDCVGADKSYFLLGGLTGHGKDADCINDTGMFIYDQKTYNSLLTYKKKREEESNSESESEEFSHYISGPYNDWFAILGCVLFIYCKLKFGKVEWRYETSMVNEKEREKRHNLISLWMDYRDVIRGLMTDDSVPEWQKNHFEITFKNINTETCNDKFLQQIKKAVGVLIDTSDVKRKTWKETEEDNYFKTMIIPLINILKKEGETPEPSTGGRKKKYRRRKTKKMRKKRKTKRRRKTTKRRKKRRRTKRRRKTKRRR